LLLLLTCFPHQLAASAASTAVAVLLEFFVSLILSFFFVLSYFAFFNILFSGLPLLGYIYVAVAIAGTATAAAATAAAYVVEMYYFVVIPPATPSSSCYPLTNRPYNLKRKQTWRSKK
jgi:hypothetical protein